jgi:hypothetical protein
MVDQCCRMLQCKMSGIVLQWNGSARLTWQFLCVTQTTAMGFLVSCVQSDQGWYRI